MKILVAVASLKLGGTERVVAFLASGLQQRGHEVVLLTRVSPDEDFYALNAAVRRVTAGIASSGTGSGGLVGRLRNFLRRQRSYRQALRSEQPDCVLAFSNHINVRMLSAVWGLKIPVVVSERNNPQAKPMRPSFRLLRRILYPQAAALVTPSRELLTYFTYVRTVNTHVIPNPVIVLPVQPVDASELGLSAERKYMLGMGRLSEQKGFDVLVDAFAAVAERHPTTDLVILGEGPLRAELESQLHERGLSGRVTLPGAVKNPHQWLAHATVFVLSSRFEGFPNVLLEAMGLGCACIATNCPTGPAEIITHNQNGLLVPVSDAAALSVAMELLLGDSALRERLGQNAIQIRSLYGEVAILDAWEHLVREVTTKAAPTAHS